MSNKLRSPEEVAQAIRLRQLPHLRDEMLSTITEYGQQVAEAVRDAYLKELDPQSSTDCYCIDLINSIDLSAIVGGEEVVNKVIPKPYYHRSGAPRPRKKGGGS